MIKTIYIIQLADPRPSDKGGPSHPDHEKRGVLVSKKFIRPPGFQFGLIIRRGPEPPGPRGPSLDPPLKLFYNHVMKIKRILKIL